MEALSRKQNSEYFINPCLRAPLVWILFAVLLIACQSTPSIVGERQGTRWYLNASLFEQRLDIISQADVFALNEAQKTDFLNYFNAPANVQRDPYMRVFDYLESLTLDFNYKSKTHIASKTISLGEGNCQSLAILTTALARLAGVKVSYQLIDSTPVFERKDDVIIKGVHVRTKLYRRPSKEEFYSGSASGLIVDYFPGGDRRFLGNISEPEFVARYYLNIAADLLAKQQYQQAYWYALEALEYAPLMQSNINTMAVIHRRIGDEVKAEAIYKFGIETATNKLSLLKNYRLLLLSQGRVKEALNIAEQISKIDDPSPYNWINIANTALKAEDYKAAKIYFEKAIELAPYLQYAYLGLAKTYYAQGRLDQTREMLLLAMENNYRRSNNGLYKAKLLALAKDQKLRLDFR